MITKQTDLLDTRHWYEKRADDKSHFLDKVYELLSDVQNPTNESNNEQQMSHNKKIVLHVGGEDVRMRIPILKMISLVAKLNPAIEIDIRQSDKYVIIDASYLSLNLPVQGIMIDVIIAEIVK